MTANASERPGRPRRQAGLGAVVHVELAKLTAQWPVRVVLLLCVAAPIAFAVFTRLQWPSGPSDTLFGRWAGTTGFATSLALLNWANFYGVPLLAGLFAGDIFAGEDRHGTWKIILTRSASRTHVFGGKAIAATVCVWASYLAMGAVSLVAGLAIAGGSSLVDLSGQLVPPGRASALVALAWLYSLLPASAFVALGLVLSTASRSTIVGVLGPLVIAGALQLLEVVGHGRIARVISLAAPFDAWHQLLTEPQHLGTVLQGAFSSIVWAAIFGGGAWYLLRNRAFGSSDTAPRLQRRVVARIVGITVAVVAMLAVVSGVGPTNLTADRLQASIAPTFGRLAVVHYRWQSGSSSGASPPMKATCNRGAGTEKSRGPGSDWACTLVDTRVADGAPPVVLDVTLRASGCYSAGAGSELGALVLTDHRGRPFVNPLYEFDGCLGTP
ncbi:ABC transporter permease [Actinopolymorpha singaporensis]